MLASTRASGGGVLSSIVTSEERGATALKEEDSQAKLQYSVVVYTAGF